MFAEIIIPLALPKNYTWSIPEALQEEIMIGMRVEVILGANKDMQVLLRKSFIKKKSDLKPNLFWAFWTRPLSSIQLN